MARRSSRTSRRNDAAGDGKIAPVPLLDRLQDENPRVPAEPEPYRAIDLDGLKASVEREVRTLLNTRCPFPEDEIDYADRSVVDYGLIDMSPYFTSNVEDQRRISQHVARTIAAYEPRLTRINVTVERVRREAHVLTVRIDGGVRYGDMVEPVSFPVAIAQDEE